MKIKGDNSDILFIAFESPLESYEVYIYDENELAIWKAIDSIFERWGNA